MGAEYHCNKTQVRKVISGVVGAASSVTSIQVANLLRLFRIPQVSAICMGMDSLGDERMEGIPIHSLPTKIKTSRINQTHLEGMEDDSSADKLRRERNQKKFLINYSTIEKKDGDYKLHPQIHNQCPLLQRIFCTYNLSPKLLVTGGNDLDYFSLLAVLPRTVIQKLTLVIIQLSIQRHPYQGILITFGPSGSR